MLGQLVVKINPQADSARAWFAEGIFSEDKPMQVIHLDNYSGTLKVLITDNKNKFVHLEMSKVLFVEFIPLLKQVEQVAPAPKGKPTKQVTLEENIAEVAAKA